MTEKTTNMLDTSVKDFITCTAEKSPTPGGGSVAGVVGGLATALGEMALNFTIGKKKFADCAELHEELSARLGRAREMFLDLVADDMEAYGMYRQAAAMADGPEKKEASALALAAAVDVPREMAKLALSVLADLDRLAGCCNQYLVSDLIAGAALAATVTVLCDLNVRINTPSLDERQAAEEIRQASADDRNKAAAMAVQIEDKTKKFLG